MRSCSTGHGARSSTVRPTADKHIRSSITLSSRLSSPQCSCEMICTTCDNSVYSNEPANSLNTGGSTSPIVFSRTIKQAYTTPKTGILHTLPEEWVPYAQLMRIEKLGGLYAFYIPYMIGLVLAANLAPQLQRLSLEELVRTAALLLVGCVLLCGAACCWNDTIDADLDRKVARCRLRPVARGAATKTQAHIFTASLTLLGALLFSSLPAKCAYHAVPVTVLFGIYPFAKRVTDYLQLLLGFPFAWAIWMASAAVDIDPFLDTRSTVTTSCYLSAIVLWTMIYDTIYAHQDIEDDAKAGVRSMAVRFRHNTKRLCTCLALAQVLLLVVAGHVAGFSVTYFVMCCGGTSIALASMIGLVDLAEPTSCWWWFTWQFWFVGGSMVVGLVGEYLLV